MIYKLIISKYHEPQNDIYQQQPNTTKNFKLCGYCQKEIVVRLVIYSH